ncbi:MAG: hypothetical protein IKR74_01565 [Bacilli bacterium]|nr:hypothetical protein [Bacilli bacterium]
MKELLDRLNAELTDENYNNYYDALEKYIKELRNLKRKADKTKEEIKREGFIESELRSIENCETYYGFPYYFLVSKNGELYEADTIDKLKEDNPEFDEGIVVQINDTIGEILVKDFYFLLTNRFYYHFFAGEVLNIKTNLNSNIQQSENQTFVDYGDSVQKIVNNLISDIITRKFGSNERTQTFLNIVNNPYFLEREYVYMINRYNEMGIVDKESVITFLYFGMIDLDAIESFLQNGFSDEQLMYYFDKIKKKYQYQFFVETIDKLYSKSNKYLGFDISFLGVSETLNKKQSEDLQVLDFLKNPDMTDFIDDGIEKYTSSSGKEPTSGNLDEIIKMTESFFGQIDESHVLIDQFHYALNNGIIIFYDANQKAELEKQYGEITDCYRTDIGKIFINNSGNYNAYSALVHEMMHYISCQKNQKISDLLREFPSIYYEYLAEKFAEQKGIIVNFSKTRIENSRALYDTLKLLDSVSSDDYKDENGSVNYLEIEKQLVNKSGDPNYIDTFLIKCHEILNSRIASTCFSYVFSTAVSEYCVQKDISPSEIYDICVNLSDFTNVNELLSRLNIDLAERKGEPQL